MTDWAAVGEQESAAKRGQVSSAAETRAWANALLATHTLHVEREGRTVAALLRKHNVTPQRVHERAAGAAYERFWGIRLDRGSEYERNCVLTFDGEWATPALPLRLEDDSDYMLGGFRDRPYAHLKTNGPGILLNTSGDLVYNGYGQSFPSFDEGLELAVREMLRR